jgi:hypothetical protein
MPEILSDISGQIILRRDWILIEYLNLYPQTTLIELERFLKSL